MVHIFSTRKSYRVASHFYFICIPFACLFGTYSVTIARSQLSRCACKTSTFGRNVGPWRNRIRPARSCIFVSSINRFFLHSSKHYREAQCAAGLLD